MQCNQKTWVSVSGSRFSMSATNKFYLFLGEQRTCHEFLRAFAQKHCITKWQLWPGLNLAVVFGWLMVNILTKIRVKQWSVSGWCPERLSSSLIWCTGIIWRCPETGWHQQDCLPLRKFSNMTTKRLPSPVLRPSMKCKLMYSFDNHPERSFWELAGTHRTSQGTVMIFAKEKGFKSVARWKMPWETNAINEWHQINAFKAVAQLKKGCQGLPLIFSDEKLSVMDHMSNSCQDWLVIKGSFKKPSGPNASKVNEIKFSFHEDSHHEVPDDLEHNKGSLDPMDWLAQYWVTKAIDLKAAAVCWYSAQEQRSQCHDTMTIEVMYHFFSFALLNPKEGIHQFQMDSDKYIDAVAKRPHPAKRQGVGQMHQCQMCGNNATTTRCQMQHQHPGQEPDVWVWEDGGWPGEPKCQICDQTGSIKTRGHHKIYTESLGMQEEQHQPVALA